MKIFIMLLMVASTLAFIECRSKIASENTPAHVSDHANGDTLSKNLYDDGKLQQVVLKKDSGECENMVLTFYQNGSLKTKGCQGHYSDKNISTGMYVGVWSAFDSLGHLTTTTFYHNDAPAKAFIERTSYYQNGQRKSVERFNNYELYEADIDSIGEWKYYNEKGELVKRINHK